MDEADYQRSQIAFLNWCATTLRRNGTLVYNHKPRRRNNTMIHPMEWISKVPRLTLMEEVIWNRGSTHNHSPRLLWPQTERLYILRRMDGMYRIANRQGCPQRSDVWDIPIPRNNGHNAPFPESLVAACLSLYSSEGDTVVDPYSGSGTVALVCRRMNRKFVGSEALPKYHALAQKRLAA
jgi:DNA modification methylase